ncbi:MAG: UpxY family transcription antiterminator [Clostridium sp.]|nr:UpxY family transcription antiterminator [Clostridium sp.]
MNRIGGGDVPPALEFKSDALPEVQKPVLAANSDTGVSTNNAPSTSKHWYAMRTTYGREQRAYDFIVSNGGTAFLPLIKQERIIKGKKVIADVSRIPNIFFVYGTEDEVKTYAFDNVHLPFLRFYYESHHEGVKIIKEPLIIPDRQIQSLQILCQAEAEDIRFVPDEMIQKFKEGDTVLITQGEFKGIEGKVARWHGQQRVAIIIEGLCVITTAYVPSAYLEIL